MIANNKLKAYISTQAAWVYIPQHVTIPCLGCLQI